MNRNALRALAADAFHQVLDNWVFRILAVLTLLPILFTFLVGLRPEGVELFFGLKSWSYAELFEGIGMGALPRDPQGMVIDFVLELCFEFLAGSLGMLLSIAATAFFVPLLLEKGAAELYFHKPVSRAWLLLSRYFAGLVFVALVSGILVIGMYLGLLLVSGRNDPGILVAALQLTYVFALVYSFSVLAGVVTRSTVAAILLSSFFFFFNGCIHQSWTALEQSDHGPSLDFEREDEDPSVEQESETSSEESEDSGEKWRVLRTALDTVHFVLPKTSDAAHFAGRLRRAIQPPEFRDEDSLVRISRLPEGLQRVEGEALARLEPGAELRGALGEARFAATAREPDVSYSLWRRPGKKSETRIAERVKVREETTSQAGQELERHMEEAGAAALSRESTRIGSQLGGGDLFCSRVRWQEAVAGAERARQALVFRDSGWIYTLLVDAPVELVPETAAETAPESPEKMDALAAKLADQLGLDLALVEDWYPSQLGFTAPLRFNILFSIGSSLAFAAAMLLLALWRLSRIAF